jgi:hypothetical protein
MNQVGQIFSVEGTLVSGENVNYVWKFWDGTAQVTDIPFVQKVLNKGGTLSYDMLAVDSSAQLQKITGSVVVNSPPLLSSVGLTENDSPSPYQTTLTSSWFDPDSAGNITVTAAGITRVISSPGVAVFEDLSVTETQTIILSGTDIDGGVTNFPIQLRVAPTPLIYAIGGVDPQLGRIGTGQTVRLTAFAEDQNGGAIVQFKWILETTNGWVTDRTFTAPGSADINDQGGGGFSSFVDVSISGETSGAKIVRLVAFTELSSVEVLIPVTLLENNLPVIESFVVSGSIGDSQSSQVSAVVTDIDGDLIDFLWNFHVPFISGNVIGNPVSVTIPIGEGSVIRGTLTATDTFGGQAKKEIPRILITSPLVAVGVRGLPFSYTLTAMGFSPVTISVSGLPTGLTLNNNVISGVPNAFGNVDVIVSASSSDGTDIKTLRLAIAEFTPPPLPVSNLLVNGSTAPTYTATESLVITYDITNELSNLEDPGAVVELRSTLGEVKSTIIGGTGVETLTITSTQINTAFGSLPTVVIRVYTSRADVRSDFYQQITVVRI